ncbi:MAG: transcriptional repressor LexA [Gammaproteobacteria bacterium]|nr:transcriptional repressor LexA [Gammaproteobacteria bacterium]
MTALTDRQALILDVIKEYIEDTGFPPTRAEIAEILGFRSPNAAEDHLRALERKGYVEILPGASRGLRLIEQEGEREGLPVVGRVAAGSPILSEEYVETYYKIDPYLFEPQANYLLQVQGMSMRDAGIYEGDLLAVHKTERVRSGQVVVARIDGEVTVKRYRKKGRVVFLEPENPDFDIIEVNPKNHSDFQIEGLAVGIIRNNVSL